MEFKKKNKIDFNVWKITLLNIKIIFSPKDYKKWGKNYLENNFKFTHWNLKTLLHFIPFILGFSNMVWSRYQDQTIPALFSKNIPATTLLKDEISWDTFKNLKIKNIDFNDVKQVDLYSKSCLLKLKNKKNEEIIGLILPIKKENSHLYNESNKLSNRVDSIISSNWMIIFNSKETPENLTFSSKLENIYYILDELPGRIEDLNINYFPNDPSSNNIIFNNEKSKIQKEKEKKIDIKKKTSNKLKKNILLPRSFLQKNKHLSEKNNLIGLIIKNDEQLITKKNKFKSSELEKNTINKLKNELNNLFYKEGIQLNLVLPNSINKKVNFAFNTYSSKETLDLLNSFLKLTSNEIDPIRNFSGYKYPDLLTKKVYKISLISNLLKNQKDYFLEIQLPTTQITAKKDNSLLNSLFYNSFLISQRKDNFFGINFDEDTNQTKSKKEEYNWEDSILNEITKSSIKTFDDFDDSDPDSWFLSFKEKQIKKNINLEEESFLKNIEQIRNLEGKSSSISFFKNKNFKYHFLPFAENFLLEKNPISLKISDSFKRTPSFTTTLNPKANSLQKTNFNFFETWEPLSIHSWMLITQFSIGLFLLQLVKDLYKDYGKELVEYVLQFASSSGIDVEEIKEQYLYDDPGYRLIRKVKKQFKDIAGIDNILLQLGEIVWFLRNNGRSAKLKNSIPNGILLTGPPGTGKTLLVQAIAGEAQVPIIVESGSLLSDPQQKGRGVERLKKIFDQARALAPCIIFIDEVDTLGEKRQNIIQTPMGSDELIESIYEKSTDKNKSNFIPKPLNLEENTNTEKDLEYQLFRNNENLEKEQIQQNGESKKTRLSLLTQFLVEMDGLKQRQGVIVIGATNRPNILDPALIRPGRFDQIINLELPGKQKRIEIFKLYGKKLQTEQNVSWSYLANRTKGFSAADIAAAMNESTIQSVINKTIHTVETIEKGIDLVTSYNNENNVLDIKKQSSDPFFLKRLAYYQSGKALLSTLLPHHPPIVVLHLWPRQKNARHSQLYENTFTTVTSKKILEAQLIGFYSGKAAELIPLYGNKKSFSLKCWQSNLGTEDLISGTFLANLLVDKWYFYSLQVLFRKNNQIFNSRNEKEFSDIEKITLSKNLETEIEDELEIEKIAKLSRLGRYQQRAFGPWWQIQAAKQSSEIKSFFAEWYRIYLPDPEENILNLEWIPPDEYHHNNNSLKPISKKSNVSFNDLYKIERDYVFHGLILNAFNKAFDLLEEKREILDYFSDFLLRYEIIREMEIKNILKYQNKTLETKKNKSNKISPIIEKDWGPNSRRKSFRFISISSETSSPNNITELKNK